MKDSSRVFGIDLGTTYSCVSYVNEQGRAEIVPNSSGKRTTPSVVWFDKGRAIVGEEAKEATKVFPLDVCQYIKRSMGDSSYFAEYGGVAYSPEEVSSFILRKLAQDASEALGERVRDVVITCPAYFFVKERDATRRAGELAGLNVLQIVNEPTSAAIAYGFREDDEDRTILVYDLGGGTFDATTIRFSRDSVDVLFTDGDHRLGGKDWDDRLVQLVAERFRDETGVGDDLLESEEATSELLLVAETAKRQLSEREKTSIRFTCEGESVRFETTRAEFEEATSDLLNKTISFAKEIARQTQAKGYGIDEILLVGGSSKMPAVSRRLEEEFGLKPRLFEPDEAVARGAAIIGNNIRLRELVEAKKGTRKGRRAELMLDEAFDEVATETGYTLETVRKSTRAVRNVSSKSFGVDLLHPTLDEERTYNLIYKNTPLPAEEETVAGTSVPNQSSCVFRLRENTFARGDYDPENGLTIDPNEPPLWSGELELPDKTLPKYSPIKVTFKLNEEGRLEATCADMKSGKFITAVVETGARSSETEKKRQKKRCELVVVE